VPCFQTSPRPGGFASLTAATGKDGHWGCYSYDKYHGTDKDKGTGAVTIMTNIMGRTRTRALGLLQLRQISCHTAGKV